MRCNCCDKQLGDKEVQWNNDLQTWEMCSTCLDIAYDAAFSDGFQNDDDYDTILVGEESFDDQFVDVSVDSVVPAWSWASEDEGWDSD